MSLWLQAGAKLLFCILAAKKESIRKYKKAIIQRKSHKAHMQIVIAHPGNGIPRHQGNALANGKKDGTITKHICHCGYGPAQNCFFVF